MTAPEGSVVRLTVDRLAPPPPVRCEGWCRGDEAALTLPLPGGGEDVVSVPVGRLVVLLADLVSLGPRPTDRSGGGPPAAPRLHWRVGAEWNGPGGAPAGRAVAAIDGGETGWWLVPDDGSDPRPANATELFRRLCALLPLDAELG